MATIRSTATAVPDYHYDQSTVHDYVKHWLGDRAHRFRRVLRAFGRGLVDTRYSVLPIDEVFTERSFEEKNSVYMEAAVTLGEVAVARCLAEAGLTPKDVDFFISTSCTGFMIPSVDAVIAHRLGMSSTLARLPITQHGCAGGAVALRQAHDYLCAHPDKTVLVLSVEIPSVTFQHGDFSAENIISASIFGDGAAAAILTSEGTDTEPTIIATDSRMFPDSADLMGFSLRNSGLKVVLSKRVPQEIRRHAPAALREFVASCGCSIDEIDHFLFHPGGRKIIEGFESALDLDENALDVTRATLRKYGNLSSATVMFVLDAYRRRELAHPGELGLLVAFGPGFGCESLLMRWGVKARSFAGRELQCGAT